MRGTPTRCWPGPVRAVRRLVRRLGVGAVAPRLAFLLELSLLQFAVGQVARLEAGTDACPIDDVLLARRRRTKLSGVAHVSCLPDSRRSTPNRVSRVRFGAAAARARTPAWSACWWSRC